MGECLYPNWKAYDARTQKALCKKFRGAWAPRLSPAKDLLKNGFHGAMGGAVLCRSPTGFWVSEILFLGPFWVWAKVSFPGCFMIRAPFQLLGVTTARNRSTFMPASWTTTYDGRVFRESWGGVTWGASNFSTSRSRYAERFSRLQSGRKSGPDLSLEVLCA